MSEILGLESIRDCLRAGLPCPLATCSPDGMPNIGYISQVQYLDQERVATSRQFFNRAPPSPYSQALITRPTTGEQFRLDLHYLHTTTEGEAFEAMRANFDAIASQTGTGPAFRLRGLDVHRVLGCTRVPSHARTTTARLDDLVEPLEHLARRLERATTYEEATNELLDALDELFGFRYAVLLAVDTPTRRLFATAGSGGAHSAVGAEVEIGRGLIGTAASRRRLIVTANLTRSQAMADALDGGDAKGPGLEIPLAGLAGARSAAAVPLIVGDDLLGVLYLESLQPSAFGGPVEGLLRIIGTQTAAALAARGAPSAEEPQRPPPPAPATSDRPAMQLVYYQADDTVLCDSDYIVKGAPGRILWSMLKAHVTTGRTQFSNRELRLDESLGLPAGNDNLEARLLVLRRRLADIGCGVLLERVGRGRLELRIERPALLTVVPTTGPMRGAHRSDSQGPAT